METKTKVIIIIVIIVIVFIFLMSSKKEKSEDALIAESYASAYSTSISRPNPIDTSGTVITDTNYSAQGVPPGSFGGGILQSNLSTGSIAGDITANIGIDVTLSAAKNRILKLAGQKLGTRALFRTNPRVVQSAGRTLTRLIGKNPKLLVKLGAKMGASSAKIFGTAGKATVTTAGKASLSALKGVSPMIVFDAVNMIMDLVDVGGYGNLTTKRMYAEMRRKTEQVFKEELAKQDPPVAYPIILSPIGELLNDEDKLLKELSDYMEANYENPVDSEIVKMLNAMDADIAAGTSNTDEYYYDLMDMTVLLNNMLDKKCITFGGMLVDGECTYTASGCEERNKWPMAEDSEAVYSEFDKNINKCILFGASDRALCERNGLEYDVEEHVCKFTETYCKTKAAEFVDGDCIIPTEQAILGLLFGDTLVNGLKQVFDLTMYEDCPYYGEITIGEGDNKTCLNANEDNTVSSAQCTDKNVQRFYYVPKSKTIHAMGKDNWIFTVLPAESVGVEVAKIGDRIELKKMSEDLITQFQKWDYDKESKHFTLSDHPELALNVEGSAVTLQTKGDSGAQKFNMTQTHSLANENFSADDYGASLLTGQLTSAYTCTILDFGNISACPAGYSASSDLNLDCSISKPVRKADCFTEYKGPITSLSGKTVPGGDFVYDNKTKKIISVADNSKVLEAESNTVGAKVTLQPKELNNFRQIWVYNWLTKHIWTEDNKFVLEIDDNLVLTLQENPKGNDTVQQAILKDIENNPNQQFELIKTNNSWTNAGLTCVVGGDMTYGSNDNKSSNIDGHGIVGTPSCPEGTINNGLGMCAGSFRREGWDDTFTNGNDDCCEQYGDEDEKQKCLDNPEYLSRNCEYHSGGIFPKCDVLAAKDGRPLPDMWRWTDGQANACTFYQPADKVGKCPESYSFNDQGFCYANCEQVYGPDFINNGTSCVRNLQSKGLDSMSCFADEYKTALGNCSKKCPENDIDMGDVVQTCMAANEKMVCDEGQFISGSRCYDTPPPMFEHLGGAVVMGKRRVIPYSTTDN